MAVEVAKGPSVRSSLLKKRSALAPGPPDALPHQITRRAKDTAQVRQ